MENDEIVSLIDKLEITKHNRVSGWKNDKLIHLWASEIYEVAKNL